MHHLRKKRLITIVLMLVGIGVACTLVLYALRQNISLYYTPEQVAAGQAPLHRTMRLGGMVALGSVHHNKGLAVQFALVQQRAQVEVLYNGVLPDLFRAGQGIVVQGQLLSPHKFVATQVLAKHDAKYMPANLDKGGSAGNTRQLPSPRPANLVTTVE